VHRVATDSDLLHRAEQLETTVDNGNYVEFCERARSLRVPYSLLALS